MLKIIREAFNFRRFSSDIHYLFLLVLLLYYYYDAASISAIPIVIITTTTPVITVPLKYTSFLYLSLVTSDIPSFIHH